MSAFSNKLIDACFKMGMAIDGVIHPADHAPRYTEIPIPKVKVVRDIPYLDDGNRYHMLNVYQHERDLDNHCKPLIIDIHGGGWYFGDKDMQEAYRYDLADRGFAVVVPSYRLAFEADFVSQIQDVFAAFNWVETHADEYGWDMNNVFITGDSAGGHLAGIATNIAMQPELQRKFNVHTDLRFNAIGYVSTMFNLTDTCRKLPVGIYFKSIIGKGYKKSEYFPFADVTYTLPDHMIPCYFITCYGDFLKRQGLRHYELYKSKGIECELFYADASEGNYKLGHVFNILHPERPESKKANQGMADFFRRYMR